MDLSDSRIDQPILIVGTGAMATLFAHFLAAQAPVIMLGCWPEALEAITAGGVALEMNGVESRREVRVSSDAREIGPVQQALVLVKSWQTERAAQQLQQCLASDGIALSLQNGLGNLEILQAELGIDRAALGVTTLGATATGPGRVLLGGEGEIHLPRDARLARIAQFFQRAGLAILWADDLQGAVWGKLVINSAINPLTAIIGCRNGELLEIEDARWLLDQVAEESALFATAQEIHLPYQDPIQIVHQVAQRSAQNISSMLADLLRGAPTEIDWINGAIARRAARIGFPTPLNIYLWKTVRARAAHRDDIEPPVC